MRIAMMILLGGICFALSACPATDDSGADTSIPAAPAAPPAVVESAPDSAENPCGGEAVPENPCDGGEAVPENPCGGGEAVPENPCGGGEAVPENPCGGGEAVPENPCGGADGH